ncbi:MAG: EamA family transporter RarD [Paracoccus denitrificans]|uniref:EamA family transporter RarD n=1 Tax=Paracoccus denitrificans TaxID=266 RepID=A0A533I6Q8_PARDE|nr:MAG: EamA family transporter RarD [Paracoccus denitrificans]
MKQPTQSSDSPKGLAYALLTYVMWGLLPLYIRELSHISPAEVIAHRILWSVPIAAAVLIAQGRTADIRAAATQPRLLAMGVLTASLITANWLIYVWSIANGHTVEAALGYYMNPLFSVLLAALLLGERLGRLQWVAVGLALLAVIILTVETGSLPLVAVGLFFSWGFYAFFKRSLALGPNQGFLLEVGLLSLPALAYLFWLHANGGGHFGKSWSDTLLLIGCGPITAIPLMFYANAAKLLKLSTIAILQYITPTMVFLIAVLVFGEPFDGAKRVAFPLIWLALAVYSYTLLRAARERRRAVHNEASLRPE